MYERIFTDIVLKCARGNINILHSENVTAINNYMAVIYDESLQLFKKDSLIFIGYNKNNNYLDVVYIGEKKTEYKVSKHDIVDFINSLLKCCINN